MGARFETLNSRRCRRNSTDGLITDMILEYYVLDATPDKAIQEAVPPFPSSAKKGMGLVQMGLIPSGEVDIAVQLTDINIDYYQGSESHSLVTLMFSRIPGLTINGIRAVQWSVSGSAEMAKVFLDVDGEPIPNGAQRMMMLRSFTATLPEVLVPDALTTVTNVLNDALFKGWPKSSALFTGYETSRVAGSIITSHLDNLAMTFMVKDSAYLLIFDLPEGASGWDELRPEFDEAGDFIEWKNYQVYDDFDFDSLFPDGWFV